MVRAGYWAEEIGAAAFWGSGILSGMRIVSIGVVISKPPVCGSKPGLSIIYLVAKKTLVSKMIAKECL